MARMKSEHYIALCVEVVPRMETRKDNTRPHDSQLVGGGGGGGLGNDKAAKFSHVAGCRKIY